MDKKKMLSLLVGNAVDFLSQAIDDLDKKPKFSLINFYTSVELFLKARLMMEHWSLVVSKKQEPDWDRFIKGDFISVSLELASERLEKVAKSGLNRHELDVFKAVANDRNKMVHFFHKAGTEKRSREDKLHVVKQQLNAWYFLQRLLVGQWSKEFTPWKDDIAKIHRRLRKQHAFLKVVFDQCAPKITDAIKSGSVVEKCPSCGFKAQLHSPKYDVIYPVECVVCDLIGKALKIKCFKCNYTVKFRDCGYSTCTKCKKAYEPDDLLDLFVDAGAAHSAILDGDDSHDPGNCTECDGYHTVIHTKDDDYLCLDCFSSFSEIYRCDWCNEPNTGDMEHSAWNGCNHCEGKAGWVRDE